MLTVQFALSLEFSVQSCNSVICNCNPASLSFKTKLKGREALAHITQIKHPTSNWLQRWMHLREYHLKLCTSSDGATLASGNAAFEKKKKKEKKNMF